MAINVDNSVIQPVPTKSAKMPPDGRLAESISCRTGAGIKAFRRLLSEIVHATLPDTTSGFIVTSARHSQKIRSALKAIARARKNLAQMASSEITAFELRQAVNEIDEITGKIYTEELLDLIFSKFCMGK